MSVLLAVAALAAGALAAGGPAANPPFLVFQHPSHGDLVREGRELTVSAVGRNGDPPANTVIQAKNSACDVSAPWFPLPTVVSARSVHAALVPQGPEGRAICLRAEAPGASGWFFPQIQVTVGSHGR